VPADHETERPPSFGDDTTLSIHVPPCRVRAMKKLILLLALVGLAGLAAKQLSSS
jgi:hypothetical protein